MIGLLAIIASIGAAADEGSTPQILNLRGLFSGYDYPTGALLLEQEGTTAVMIAVDAHGKASGCTVEQSSGSASLDEQTCRLYCQRGKFAPARDSSGRPVAGSIRQRVTWRMTETELPIAPWTVRLLALVEPNSAMRNCGVEGGGALKDNPRGIVDCSELAGMFTVSPELLKKVAGHETILAFDKQFVPKVVNSIDAPRDLRRYTFLGQEVVNLKIGPDGSVTNCIKRSTQGAFSPVVGACETLPRRTFKIPRDSKGQPTSIWATATMAVYSRP